MLQRKKYNFSLLWGIFARVWLGRSGSQKVLLQLLKLGIYRERDAVRKTTRGAGTSGLSATIATTVDAAVTGTPVTVCRYGAQRRMACRYGVSGAVGCSWQHALSWHLGYFGLSGGPRLKEVSASVRVAKRSERASSLNLIRFMGLLGQPFYTTFWACDDGPRVLGPISEKREKDFKLKFYLFQRKLKIQAKPIAPTITLKNKLLII
ncbi:hypothetical protein Nepgr_016176 [Nepenthes gracilis]|uniref:Uncharacterized protein n=1 Tax=Nepenthes gracilis TaxID=150966 RepID=A0AAD3SP75_NEPGR|nr:hypothetical protein Nepgr_016176 [Nepenthes gracilis]